jgi:acyl-CoA thioester hydrolase
MPPQLNPASTPFTTPADYPIRSHEKLRFADTDQNGHISNAVFAVCCQNARMELLADRSRIPLPADGQFVIARLELAVLGEMHWPGTVEIGTRIDRVGRSSLILGQALYLKKHRVAEARSIVVLIDRATRRPTTLPAETVTALLALAGVATGNPRPDLWSLPRRGRED